MRTVAWALLLFGSLPLFSQVCEAELTGRVVDAHDGSGLSGATIILAGLERSALTDIDANFVIPNLCDGRYRAQVSHPGCITQVFDFTVKGNTKKTFRLEHHLDLLNEIVLKGKATETVSKTTPQKSISQKTLERFSGSSLGDVLNSLSGVSSLNTGNTVKKPMINGLHSSQVLVINSGVQMEDQEWGAEHAPNIDISSAGRITVVKGASALQYGGNAAGGTIIIEAEKIPLKDSLFGKTTTGFSLNGRGSFLTSEITKSYENGWFAKLHGSLKRAGDFEAPAYVLSNTGLSEKSIGLRLGLHRTAFGLEGSFSIFDSEMGILRASHLGGAQDQIAALNSEIPLIINDFTYSIDAPKQDVAHLLFKLKGYRKFENFGKLTFQYDFQKNNRLEFDIRRGENAGKPSVDLELLTHTATLALETALSEKMDFKTGLTARYQNNFANPGTGVRRLIPDFEKYEAGVYAVAVYEINDELLLEAGARFDYVFMDVLKFYRKSFWESRSFDLLFPELIVEDFGDQILTNPELVFENTSATAGLVYEFSSKNKLFINYSLATRSPNPSELFSEGLHHSASRIELGDLRFVPEVSHKISATFQQESERLSFSLNPYLNHISDFILIEPTGIQQTIRGNFQVWEYRQTQAQLLGLDVDLAFPLMEKLRLVNQFSLVKGYDKTKDRPLINMPSAQLQNEIVYENPSFKNLRLSLQSIYVFQQNEFPDNNFEIFVPETESHELLDLSTPPRAYHLLNFSAEVDLYSRKGRGLQLGLSVSNLFDTSYRNYLNRFRHYADELGRDVRLSLKFNY